MSRPHCHRCLRQLAYSKGVLVFSVRTVEGHQIRLHKDCAERFDNERAAEKLTAAETEKGQYFE